jgi:hypothetical protein
MTRAKKLECFMPGKKSFQHGLISEGKAKILSIEWVTPHILDQIGLNSIILVQVKSFFFHEQTL